jgi:methylenetetrahydrofolate dehydrogenase (NADP+)/methenyltetrahydrofolate cyclohydrolase
MKIINGTEIANSVLCQLENKIAHIAEGMLPCLAVVLVGDDPASKVYVRAKEKKCEQIHMRVQTERLPHSSSTYDVLSTVWNLNNDPYVNGIIVQMPLPEHVNSNKVIEAINVAKDVDGFHPYNIGRLATRNPFFRPCTPFGIMTMLQHINEPFKGRHAVIVGASNIVGRPLALEMLLSGATVTICHKFTKHLEEHTQLADILVSATGIPNFITEDMVKQHATVIDVGISRTENGLVGDVDFEAVREVADYITPVPGGVGPMTIAMLLSNTVQAFEIQHKEFIDLKK